MDSSSRLSQMLLDLQRFRSSGEPSNSIRQRTLGKLHRNTRVGPSRARTADTSGRSPAQQVDEAGVASLVELLDSLAAVWPAAEELLCAEGMQDLLAANVIPGGWDRPACLSHSGCNADDQDMTR